MFESCLTQAHRLLAEALAVLDEVADPGAGDDELIGVLTLGEGVTRHLGRAVVGALTELEHRGTFAARGYRRSTTALADLLGWDHHEARRHLLAADQVGPRHALDGTPLPPRLPATAAVFATGAAGLRHVEIIARLLAGEPAARLDPEVWAGAEAQLAAWSPDCTPTELQRRGVHLIDTLDAEGAEPDDRPRPTVNELHLHRNTGGCGGTITGRYGDAAMFDAVATLIDATAAPRTLDDDRPAAQRRAEALADACGYVLDHGSSDQLPAGGGRRPHLNVHIRLEDLQNLAHAAVLDFGGTLSPESLRILCCDAAVIPIVLSGAGQPLDVGRRTRTIPDGIRRAVAARDRGCARCGRPPSWTEIHHIVEWQHGGPTSVDNGVMLCRSCHRLIHHAGWDVRLVDGTPEFYPPPWIDPERRARRRPSALPPTWDAAA